MSKVNVDWTKCNGCGTCVDSARDSKKSVPVRADDCILCMTCAISCPTGAITVEEK